MEEDVGGAVWHDSSSLLHTLCTSSPYLLRFPTVGKTRHTTNPDSHHPTCTVPYSSTSHYYRQTAGLLGGLRAAECTTGNRSGRGICSRVAHYYTAVTRQNNAECGTLHAGDLYRAILFPHHVSFIGTAQTVLRIERASLVAFRC
jgi:hypothetical protein